MKYSYDFIKFINDEVLEYLPKPYYKIGNKINLKCFLCGDSKKSPNKKRFFYYLETCTGYCFNCGTYITGLDIISHFSGLRKKQISMKFFKNHLKDYPNEYHPFSLYEYPSPIPEPNELKNVISDFWKLPLSDKAKDYLNSRRILEAPFLMEPLYSCRKNNDEYILIPWLENGIGAYYQLHDFQKISNSKYIFPFGLKRRIYGLDNIDVSFPYIFIFEGVFDAIFVKNGIAVGSKCVTNFQMNILKNRYPKHQLVIAFDNDSSGIEATKKLLENNKNNFKFLKWYDLNESSKDINDLILRKNDINLFKDKSKLKNMIKDQLQMKLEFSLNFSKHSSSISTFG